MPIFVFNLLRLTSLRFLCASISSRTISAVVAAIISAKETPDSVADAGGILEPNLTRLKNVFTGIFF